jgi:hypothetical protein
MMEDSVDGFTGSRALPCDSVRRETYVRYPISVDDSRERKKVAVYPPFGPESGSRFFGSRIRGESCLASVFSLDTENYGSIDSLIRKLLL